MKSRKIRRSELVLDKIEGVDSKRKIMCIHFGHPIKKTALVRALHGRRPWPDLSSMGGVHGGLPERKGGGRGRGGVRGVAGALRGHGEGLLLEEGSAQLYYSESLCSHENCPVSRRRERKLKKKGKEKKGKIGKKIKLGNF
jgi:hypothetical protein